jgi:hypothetical protein
MCRGLHSMFMATEKLSDTDRFPPMSCKSTAFASQNLETSIWNTVQILRRIFRAADTCRELCDEMVSVSDNPFLQGCYSALLYFN